MLEKLGVKNTIFLHLGMKGREEVREKKQGGAQRRYALKKKLEGEKPRLILERTT